NIHVAEDDGVLTVTRSSDDDHQRSLHGLYRSLINNMIIGVTEGYQKELELRGVGFRASMSNGVLRMTLGYSHPIYFAAPDDVAVDTERKQETVTIGSRINNELVGQVAATIRSPRTPGPYNGKGIRYVDEWVRRKAGKSAAKA